jgi:hypothetical protein
MGLRKMPALRFQHACEQLGLVLPENVEALIVLDRQFREEHA